MIIFRIKPRLKLIEDIELVFVKYHFLRWSIDWKLSQFLHLNQWIINLSLKYFNLTCFRSLDRTKVPRSPSESMRLPEGSEVTSWGLRMRPPDGRLVASLTKLPLTL